MITFPSTRKIVKKPWGYEDWIYNGEYCGKILSINEGKHSSFHYHVNKDEVLYLHSGVLEVRYSHHDDFNKTTTARLMPGAAFHVAPGLRHRLYAITKCLIYEFSTHHEDSDSYRIEVKDGE